jgi:L-threonylcarbamoyladenylate synthase
MTDVPILGFNQRDAIVAALRDGQMVAVPDVGGYALAASAASGAASARLAAVSPATVAAQCYLVGSTDQAHELVGSWSADTTQLMNRCWPGPVTIVLAADGHDQPVNVRMPKSRPLRHLVRDSGPWLVAPLGLATPAEVQQWAEGLAAGGAVSIVDGGRCLGLTASVVDATGPTLRIVEDGALPAAFIEGALMMAGRRRWFKRSSGTPSP